MTDSYFISKTPHRSSDAWYKVGPIDLGLHLLFVAALFQLSSSVAAAYVSSFFVIIATSLLMWGSLHGMSRRWHGVVVPISVIIGAVVMAFAVIVILMAAVLYDGTIVAKIRAFSPYLWSLIAMGGIDEKEWNRVMRAFRVHALIGTLSFILVLIFGGISDYSNRASFFTEDGSYASPTVWCRQLMYSYPVLLILLPRETWFWRCVGIAVTLSMTVWAILSQFRSALVLGVGLAVVLSLYAWYRARCIGWLFQSAAIISLLFCFSVGSILIFHDSVPKFDAIETAWTQIVGRFTGDASEDEDTGLKNVRYVAADEYLRNLTLSRFILGDEGEWISASGIVMHVGHLRYIVYGGLPTLIAIWLLLYWQGCWYLLTSRQLAVLSAASIAAMHLIQAIPAGMLGEVPQTAMLFICACYCWHASASKRLSPRISYYER